MFDKKTVNKIVKDTIDSIQSTHEKTRSDEHLVIAAFLMETGMIGMYHDDVPARHGLMAMSLRDFEEFVYNKLRLNKPLMEDIRNIALIDMTNDSIEDMFEALMYNVAFQVMIVWAFYRIHLSDMPRDINAVASAYCNVWDKKETKESDVVGYLVEWLNNGE